MKKRTKSRRSANSVTGSNGDQYPRMLYTPPCDIVDNVATKPESIPHLEDVVLIRDLEDDEDGVDGSAIYEVGVYKLVGVQRFKAVTPSRPPMKVFRVK